METPYDARLCLGERRPFGTWVKTIADNEVNDDDDPDNDEHKYDN